MVKTTKERPVRVFFDKKTNSYYIIKKGKRHKLNLPEEIKNLKSAQKYVGQQFRDKIDLDRDFPITYRLLPEKAYDPFERNKPLKERVETPQEIYRAFIESNIYHNLSPEELKIARERYEEEEKDKRLRELQTRDLVVPRAPHIVVIPPAIMPPAPVPAIMPPPIPPLPVGRLPVAPPPLPPPPPILPLPAAPSPIPPPPANLGPAIVNIPPPGPGPNPHRLPAANERKRQEAREDRFFRRVVKELGPYGINHDDFKTTFDLWNGPKSDQIYTDIPIAVALYLVNKQNNYDIYKHFVGRFGVTANDTIITRARKILQSLGPTEYEQLVADGSLPSNIFYTRVNPSYIGSGYATKNGQEAILPALYNDEIEDFFAAEPRFGGVISSDQINKIPHQLPVGFIMNLDKSTEPGSHWVAIYINGDSIEYFNPLGDPPSEQFITDIKKWVEDSKIPIMMKLKINKIQQQHGSSVRCGYHSIRFLDDRFNDIDFPLASRYHPDKKINNSKEGEAIIKKEFELI